MKSKNSLCNKALIKSDVHRFGPVIIFATIFVQLLVILPLISEMTNLTYEEMDMAISNLIDASRTLSLPVLPFLVGIIVPALLYNYMNVERETYTLHSLPLSRQCMFFSHYVFGLATIYIPLILGYLGIGIVNVYYCCKTPLGICGSFLLSVIEYFFFYNMGCLVMMLCGSSVIAVIVHIVLGATPYALTYLTDSLQYLLPVDISFTFNIFQKLELLNPFYFFRAFPVYALNYSGNPWYTDTFHIRSILCLAISLVPAIVFLFLSVFLYKKRNIESVGELMVFRFANVTFRFVFTFFASILTAMLATELVILPILERLFSRNTSYISTAILIVALSPFYYVMATMILQKSFRIKKTIRWKYYPVTLLVLLLYLYTSQIVQFRYQMPDAEYTTISFALDDNMKVGTLSSDGYYEYKLPKAAMDELIDVLTSQQQLNKEKPRRIDELYSSYIVFTVDTPQNQNSVSSTLSNQMRGVTIYQYLNETQEILTYLENKSVEHSFHKNEVPFQEDVDYIR